MAPFSREVRAMAFGLMRGMGGANYSSSEVSKLLKDRFNVTVDPATLRNWKSAMAKEMTKYGITEQDIQDAVLKGLSGKIPEVPTVGAQPPSPHAQAYTQPPPAGEVKPSTPPEAPPQKQLIFNNVAEVVAWAEGQGFIVGKSPAEIITMLESQGMQVIDKKQILFSLKDLYFKPIELDIDAIGRSVAANPIIQLYYALQRMVQPDVELGEFLTACVLDSFNRRKTGILIVKGLDIA